MEKHEFKAESKRLLDLMINSIYTHREIFLREIISNASDAIDKLAYTALTDEKVGLSREDFAITITRDEANGILTVSDNGIGMTKAEMEENLGTIAKSGSLNFKQNMEKNEAIDIIGQFGVGFYSAFMVASSVTVISRKYGEDTARKWTSEGAEGYTIEPATRETAGTDVIMVLKKDTEEDQYSDFLKEYQIRSLIRKYSDYVRYPIRMEVSKSRMKPGCDEENPEYESYMEQETLNSMVPIWQKAKKDVTEEEYQGFYREKFHDFTAPLRTIHVNIEGSISYKALLFIPERAPYDFYTKDYKGGLQLYSSGVMIMDNCEDLLPDHFRFVRGVVDSQDLSLNISREMLQQDHQLKLIRNALEKKIKNELLAMLRNDREKYEGFWKAFGRQLKFGAYSDYGMHAELLRDLLLFYSAKEQKLVTLEEYVAAMPAEQKCVYFAAGENTDRLAKLPAAQLVLDKGYDLLLLTEDVDEFCLQILHSYPRKDAEGKDGTVEFKNVNSGDLGLESEEEKTAAEEATAENQSLFAAMMETLGVKFTAVKVSTRLKDHPVCLSAEGPLSIEMEKVLASQPGAEGVKSDKVLELNAAHPVFAALQAAQAAGDTEKLTSYSQILLAQAQLIEGLPVDDPVAYAQAVCSLMK